MEELKITITKESNITTEEIAEFIQQFNLLKNEEAKRQIMALVRSMMRAENN